MLKEIQDNTRSRSTSWERTVLTTKSARRGIGKREEAPSAHDQEEEVGYNLEVEEDTTQRVLPSEIAVAVDGIPPPIVALDVDTDSPRILGFSTDKPPPVEQVLEEASHETPMPLAFPQHHSYPTVPTTSAPLVEEDDYGGPEEDVEEALGREMERMEMELEEMMGELDESEIDEERDEPVEPPESEEKPVKVEEEQDNGRMDIDFDHQVSESEASRAAQEQGSLGSAAKEGREGAETEDVDVEMRGSSPSIDQYNAPPPMEPVHTKSPPTRMRPDESDVPQEKTIKSMAKVAKTHVAKEKVKSGVKPDETPKKTSKGKAEVAKKAAATKAISTVVNATEVSPSLSQFTPALHAPSPKPATLSNLAVPLPLSSESTSAATPVSLVSLATLAPTATTPVPKSSTLSSFAKSNSVTSITSDLTINVSKAGASTTPVPRSSTSTPIIPSASDVKVNGKKKAPTSIASSSRTSTPAPLVASIYEEEKGESNIGKSLKSPSGLSFPVGFHVRGKGANVVHNHACAAILATSSSTTSSKHPLSTLELRSPPPSTSSLTLTTTARSPPPQQTGAIGPNSTASPTAPTMSTQSTLTQTATPAQPTKVRLSLKEWKKRHEEEMAKTAASVAEAPTGVNGVGANAGGKFSCLRILKDIDMVLRSGA